LHEGRPVSENDIRKGLRVAGKDPDRMINVLRALQHKGLIVKVIDDSGTSWMLPSGGLENALSQMRGA
jgi:hypothetical protein